MLKQFEDKMQKSLDSMANDFMTIRAGRANPHVLDKVKVDYYGVATPVAQVGNVSVPEARTIMIQPWEPNLLKEIEKAILVSDIGITPTNDGKAIRLNFPDLTEERRKELAKDVKKRGEEAKVAVRNIRRDANDFVKKQNKAGDLNDDQAKDEEDKVQKMKETKVIYDTQEVQMENLNIPQHVAIILDGNGRWAKKRHLPRNMGHRQGSKVVEQIIEDAHDLGIKYLTVYAFSTENWKRPQDEVNALMKLLRDYLKTCIKRANKNNMKVRVIGDITGLSEDLQEKIVELEKASKDNTGINFTIALNYGSRDEMVRAMRHMADDLSSGNLSKDEITEEVFNGYLDTKELPDPDLMIRTSGEERLSNFMLWQLAYTEFYFTDVLWPDFNKKELIKAIEYYNGRDRRFGGI